MIYRREIDGLRAVAVVPVILFHAGVELFSGGFVGVDVFFVISGFLITTILLIDLEADRFSILHFYERRARRILPALTLVMVCCIPFALAWLMPSELKDFSQSILAASLFASNILFWQEEGYFAAASENKPLLHTWSLAVEEQFYIFFPILLFLLWKRRSKRVELTLIVFAVASLLLSELGWRNAPGANFYLAPFRAWELLAGSICAFYTRREGLKSNRTLSALGLAMIVVSVFAFDENTPFPSLYALLPVIGTALVICFGHQGTFVARVLSFQPIVLIGLISYSAYLWHQPLFAFARIRTMDDPSPLLMAALVLATFFLAYLSWRFVENPFRNAKTGFLTKRIHVFALSGGSIAAMLAVGAIGHLAQGLPNRLAPSGATYASLLASERLAPNYGLSSKCEGSFTLDEACRTAEEPGMILWGDSYAMHLARAFQHSPTEIGMLQLTKSQCAPIPDLSMIGSITTWQQCMEFNDQALAFILQHQTVKYVVVSSPFSLLDPGVDIYERDGSVAGEEHLDLVANKIRDLAARLSEAGKKLVIVSPPPNTGRDLGLCLVRAEAFGQPAKACDFMTSELSQSYLRARKLLNEVDSEARVIWLEEMICGDAECAASKDSVFLYRDEGHLSFEGASYVGKRYDLTGMIVSE